ncbi:MAG: Tad domain-containing protein [Chloroflexota bacterium]|nr:Tad domain-containing protein [Chloroflexota bacterium]
MIDLRKLIDRPVESGQILVISAAMMVVLIGMTALAIDVSAAYLTQRWERSVADAAALSGAQSLQKPGTRELPGEPERVEARANAIHILEDQLGGTAGASGCYSSAGCAMTGTAYRVSVQTPSPSCVDCSSARSMMVSIWQPQFGLTFGRILGALSWEVRSTSVAGMVIAPQYGIVALRPSQLRPNLSDANYDDIVVTGGSKVIVGNSDIATNSNATCSGSGSEIVIDTASGFDIHHFGAGARWTAPPGDCLNPPPGFQVTSLVEDPGYPIPVRTGAPIYATPAEAMGTVASGPHQDPNYATRCAAQQALVPSSYIEHRNNQRINDPTQVTARCYRPGVYRFRLDSITNMEAVLLEPGVYFLDYGGRTAASLIGGYVPDQPGVALVMKEAKNTSGEPGQLETTNPDSILALNFGNAYCPDIACPPSPKPAKPAVAPDGTLVQTPAPQSTLMTLIVVPDANCVVESPPPAACNEANNKTLKLSGGGAIFLAGVQYAPSDNAVLTGGSGQDSDVGAFWAWTMTFNGGTNFNLSSQKPAATGVLRIDAACSPNVSVCNP